MSTTFPRRVDAGRVGELSELEGCQLDLFEQCPLWVISGHCSAKASRGNSPTIFSISLEGITLYCKPTTSKQTPAVHNATSAGRFGELAVGAGLDGEQSAGKQRQRNEQHFHDTSSIFSVRLVALQSWPEARAALCERRRSIRNYRRHHRPRSRSVAHNTPLGVQFLWWPDSATCNCAKKPIARALTRRAL